MTEQWMKMGEEAFEKGDYKNAYEYFTRAAVEDSNNWMAVFLRGKAAAYQSTFSEPRINEFTEAVNDAIEIISNIDLSEEEEINIKKFFTKNIYNFVNQFYKETEKRISRLLQKEIEGFGFSSYVGNNRIQSLDLFEAALNLLVGIHDEKTFKLRLEIKKSIVWLCHLLCKTIRYKGKLGIYVLTNIIYRNLENKNNYISRHDELLLEIRMIEPDFKNSNHDKDLAIDRLEIPENIEEIDLKSRQVRLQRLQAEIDRNNRMNEVEYRRQYWEKHPEEYKFYSAYLEEKKRKQEEIKKRKQEKLAEQKRKEQEYAKQKKVKIDLRLTQLNEQAKDLDQKIEQLKSERNQLGLFAGKKKREIDAKVYALNNTNRKVQREISQLRMDLSKLINILKE